VSAEWFAAVVAMTLAGSLAILGILALRVPMRRTFGAQLAYATWMAVPLVVCAVLLPAPTQPVEVFMRIAPVGVPVRLVADGAAAVLDVQGMLLGVWLLGVGMCAVSFV